MRQIPIEQLNLNAYTAIAKDWMLVTAGNKTRGWNTMTASWGHIGSIWVGPTAVCYVRPQRYTKQFMDRETFYTLSFFPQQYHKDLAYLGSHSGRDEDKVAKTALTPVFDAETTWFHEASVVLVCRKLYQAPLEEQYFIDKEVLEKHYSERDFHDLYIGEIIKVLVNE